MSGVLDVTARYEATLRREGTPRQRLGYLFAFHMDEGTRPVGDRLQSIPWTTEQMSEALGLDRRNISYYRQGTHKFPYGKTVLAIFGPADQDTPERRCWRRDMLHLYREVERTAALADSPTHRIYAVRKPGTEEKNWSPIGTASPNKSGRGLSLKLDLLPVGEAEIVLCKIDDFNLIDLNASESALA